MLIYREETFRFICIIEHGLSSPDTFATKRQLSTKAYQEFIEVNALHLNEIDTEHKVAWKDVCFLLIKLVFYNYESFQLNKASFNISYSKAPDALNVDLIDVTKAALLSSVPAPLLEKNVPQTIKDVCVFVLLKF